MTILNTIIFKNIKDIINIGAGKFPRYIVAISIEKSQNSRRVSKTVVILLKSA